MSGVFGGQKLIKKQFNDKCGTIIMINSPTPSLSLPLAAKIISLPTIKNSKKSQYE